MGNYSQNARMKQYKPRTIEDEEAFQRGKRYFRLCELLGAKKADELAWACTKGTHFQKIALLDAWVRYFVRIEYKL